jgi:hypothetical protein
MTIRYRPCFRDVIGLPAFFRLTAVAVALASIVPSAAVAAPAKTTTSAREARDAEAKA